MNRIAFIALLFCIVIASCESANQPSSPLVPQAALTRSTPMELCFGFGGGTPNYIGYNTGAVLSRSKAKDKFAVYSTGFWPIQCGDNPLNPAHVILEDGMWYKVYFALADGGRLLIGADHHPFTVPLTEGPQHEGNSFGNGQFTSWTFVVEGQGTTLPILADNPDNPHFNILIVELWGRGGKIAESQMGIDAWPIGPRGPKTRS